jgi:hypothetical protein
VRDGSIAWTVRDAVVDLKIAAATGDGLKEHFLARKHGTGLALSSDHLDGLVAELDSLRSFGELQGCLAGVRKFTGPLWRLPAQESRKARQQISAMTTKTTCPARTLTWPNVLNESRAQFASYNTASD